MQYFIGALASTVAYFVVELFVPNLRGKLLRLVVGRRRARQLERRREIDARARSFLDYGGFEHDLSMKFLVILVIFAGFTVALMFVVGGLVVLDLRQYEISRQSAIAFVLGLGLLGVMPLAITLSRIRKMLEVLASMQRQREVASSPDDDPSTES